MESRQPSKPINRGWAHGFMAGLALLSCISVRSRTVTDTAVYAVNQHGRFSKRGFLCCWRGVSLVSRARLRKSGMAQGEE